MAEQLQLTPEDLETLIEISQQVVDWKHHTLSSTSWSIFQSVWLPKLVEQLAHNSFTVHSRHRNTFRWLRDQIQWSRCLTPGVRRSDQLPLADTELGQRAIDICERASQGRISYSLSRPNQTLFS